MNVLVFNCGSSSLSSKVFRSQDSGRTEVVLSAKAHRVGVEDINRLLCKEGGFSGWCGKNCGFLDIVDNREGSELSLARGIYQYQIIKNIGSLIPVLSGIDAIAFTSEHIEESLDFFLGICKAFKTLGIQAGNTPEEHGGLWNLAKEGSPVKLIGIKYNRWGTMADAVRVFLDRRGVIDNGGGKEISRRRRDKKLAFSHESVI